MNISFRDRTALNGICPYFTMFPLDFPYSILQEYASKGEWVLDPFCGRGTTNYASRLLDMPTIGIDSSPVAVALSEAKLANTSPDKIIQEAQTILQEESEPQDIPIGEFWNWAFASDVLIRVCKFRESLLADCVSDTRKALRAILMGALHGPRGKVTQSYFSNQCQRTYAPKPGYAVKYWKRHELIPQSVNVLEIISRRAKRYYTHESSWAHGYIVNGDSRDPKVFSKISQTISWVITSPPYYGIRTYIPDQWLRVWFLGGPSHVDYGNEHQMEHSSQDDFADQLRGVWQNTGMICRPGARLIVRFGGINDRKVDTVELITRSLAETAWKIDAIASAGSASDGRRQALQFSHPNDEACEEKDIWATWQGQ